MEVKEEKQDNTKFLKTILMILVVLFIGVLMFGGGFVVGRFMPAAGAGVIPAQLQPSAPSGDQQSNTPEGLQDTFAPFWETWNLVHSQYVEQPVDDVALVQGAIRGMLETLTVGRNYYYDPKEMQNEQDVLNGKDYEGIGAYVDVDGEYLTVVSAIRGSPAEAAGLRSGDQFIAVDGKDVTGQPPEDVRLKVIGPAGTDVVLTVLRKGVDAPFDVTITRAKITTPLVEYELRDDGIAYVRLNTFGDSADAELRDALKELLAKNPKGLILDLRYNGGGYLDQGIAVASEFLPADKPVVPTGASSSASPSARSGRPTGLPSSWGEPCTRMEAPMAACTVGTRRPARRPFSAVLSSNTTSGAPPMRTARCIRSSPASSAPTIPLRAPSNGRRA